MPKAVNGTYSLPAGSLVNSGDTILVSQHNPPLEDIAEALTSSLDRDGKGGMRANLDMGGYRITNIAVGVTTSDVATLGQVRSPAVIALAATEIDCGNGTYFTKTVDEDTAFTFVNAPAGAYGFTLRVHHTSGEITFPASVVWPRGSTMPTLTLDRTHLFMFSTDNGGTVWRAAALPDYTD